MKPLSQLVRMIPATALLTLPLACGGGGGGGDTLTPASATQVGQAVLVVAAAIDAAGTALDTGTGAVTTASVPPVQAAAMGMGDVTSAAHGHFAGMAGGPGQLDLAPTSCDGAGSGTVATHMGWSDLDPQTLCVDDLTSTFTLDDCTREPGERVHGTMGMAISGSTCAPTAINMDFAGTTVTTPEGSLSGDFTMAMTGMTFAGDPAELDVNGATVTFNGAMQMGGGGFGTVAMDMDHLAYHFDDTTHTGDVNGILTVHCDGQAFPMTMVTDTDGLTLDTDGNVIGGNMTVTAQGTAHQVAFNADGSVDVTPDGGMMVHMADPVAADFCAL